MKIAMCGYKGKTGSKVYQVLKANKYEVIGIEKDEKYFEIAENRLKFRMEEKL